GPHPAGPLRPARPARGGGQGCPSRGRDRPVGRHAASERRNPRALHVSAVKALARACAELRGLLPEPRLPTALVRSEDDARGRPAALAPWHLRPAKSHPETTASAGTADAAQLAFSACAIPSTCWPARSAGSRRWRSRVAPCRATST